MLITLTHFLPVSLYTQSPYLLFLFLLFPPHYLPALLSLLWLVIFQDVIEDIEGILGTTIQNMDQTDDDSKEEEEEATPPEDAWKEVQQLILSL